MWRLRTQALRHQICGYRPLRFLRKSLASFISTAFERLHKYLDFKYRIIVCIDFVMGFLFYNSVLLNCIEEIFKRIHFQIKEVMIKYPTNALKILKIFIWYFKRFIFSFFWIIKKCRLSYFSESNIIHPLLILLNVIYLILLFLVHVQQSNATF